MNLKKALLIILVGLVFVQPTKTQCHTEGAMAGLGAVFAVMWVGIAVAAVGITVGLGFAIAASAKHKKKKRLEKAQRKETMKEQKTEELPVI